MTKSANLQAVLPLLLIDEGARDGGYKFLADDTRFALGRWNGEFFAYPGNAPVEFTPKYYRCAKRVVAPAEGDVRG